MENVKTKVLILGSGPAGCTAAIYTARAGLSPIMMCGIDPGGQLTITTEVENYPGFREPILGSELMENMIEQAKNVGARVVYNYIKEVDFSKKPFICLTDKEKYICDTVIISTGAQAKWLGLKSEQDFKGFGVSGCATCDGPFYKNKKVLVVGGGNTAVEEALYLSKIASDITLIHRGDSLRAEKILQQRLFENTKIKIIWNHVLDEALGTEIPKVVNGAIIKNVKTDQKTKLDLDGIFIAIGHKPNTDLFKPYLKLDNDGYIIANHDTSTNIKGIFAAGDVADKVYRQAITAAGTGCMAALEVEKFLSYSGGIM